MQIAICDNDVAELKRLSAMLARYAAVHHVSAPQISSFSRCDDLLDAVHTGRVFDLCLLDADMENLGGIRLAEAMAHLPSSEKPPLFFLSRSGDHAVDAFRVRALHYLLKPVMEAELFAALDEVLLPLMEARDLPVIISTVQNKRATVPLSGISYAECVAHTIHYHMTDGAVLRSRSIRVPFATAIAPLLESGRFLQPHRSFAVNLEQVLRLNGQEVVLINGTRLPVSRLRLAQFRTAYQHYLRRTGRTK